MMKSKKFVSLLMILSLCAVKSNGQAPGYMGKKFVGGYGFYFNPAFSNIVMDYGDKPFNVMHEFFLEAATGKKFVLGASAKLYRYTYNNIELVDVTSGMYNSSINQIDKSPRGTYKIKARNYSVYGKFFKANYLAPWGKYFNLGLTLYTYETTYNSGYMKVQIEEKRYVPSNGYYVSTQGYVSNFGEPVQTYKSVDILFGNGNSRIFANKIVLDYGYNINVIAMSRIFLNALDFKTTYPEEYIKSTSTKRIAAINRFNFYIKVGYLF